MSPASVEGLTSSPTADSPSADPLDLLPLRQLLVFVARAHRRSLSELAELLGIHRDTVHADLKAAIRTLSVRVPLRPVVRARPGRPYSCRRHQGNNCTPGCPYLRRFLKDFDTDMPPGVR